MKVKVIKSSKESYWYADKIGEVFDVYLNEEHKEMGEYSLLDGSAFICLKDAIIQPEEDTTISAEHFCRVLLANVKNDGMGDLAFRNFVDKTLEIVKFTKN